LEYRIHDDAIYAAINAFFVCIEEVLATTKPLNVRERGIGGKRGGGGGRPSSMMLFFSLQV